MARACDDRSVAKRLEETSYVLMDWGPDFGRQHDMNFPDVAPDLSFDLGPLALSYVLSSGGSGYFRMSAVEQHLAAGELHLVPDMPQYSYPVYSVRSANVDESVVGPALAGLRAIPKAISRPKRLHRSMETADRLWFRCLAHWQCSDSRRPSA